MTEKNIQILKCRDDHKPIMFSCESAPADAEKPFLLNEGSECSWAKPSEPFGTEKLRPRIEPWLTALCQSDHLSLLLGSGLPNAVLKLATGDLLPGMATAEFSECNEAINEEVKVSAQKAGRGNGNLEDQIRAANELLRGLEIMGTTNAGAKKHADALVKEIEEVLSDFAGNVLFGERNLMSADEKKRVAAFNYLVSFLMSFGSRTGTRDRLHIFTTNYDRFIEAGAEVAGVRLMDRFVGALAPIFRSSRLDLDMHYNPPGIRGEPRYLEGVARFTKLHGSLDWVDCDRNIRRLGIPFGVEDIKPYFAFGGKHLSAKQLMIYPNSAKDRETAAYPYVELFRDLAASICRPNSTLVTFGYGFGDDHINRVIEDMLTIPSTHLVVISYDDPLGRIMKTYQNIGRHAQISVLIGDHIGEFQTLVDYYLPKPAIDRTTFRMAELLKARWTTVKDDSDSQTEKSLSVGEE